MRSAPLAHVLEELPAHRMHLIQRPASLPDVQVPLRQGDGAQVGEVLAARLLWVLQELGQRSDTSLLLVVHERRGPQRACQEV
jgi:hypothetical protein